MNILRYCTPLESSQFISSLSDVLSGSRRAFTKPRFWLKSCNLLDDPMIEVDVVARSSGSWYWTEKKLPSRGRLAMHFLQRTSGRFRGQTVDGSCQLAPDADEACAACAACLQRDVVHSFFVLGIEAVWVSPVAQWHRALYESPRRGHSAAEWRGHR